MITIHLHGTFGEEFVAEFRADVRDAAEAVRAICANFPGAEAFIRDHNWHLVRGDDLETGDSLTAEQCEFGLGNNDLHFVPAVAGAGGGNSKGIFGIILGVVLIAVGAYLGGNPTLILAGISLIAGGAATLLTPVPELSPQSLQDREQPERRQSFLFNGPVNSIEQGGPVPVVYGRMMVGSTMVSAGLQTEQILGGSGLASEQPLGSGEALAGKMAEQTYVVVGETAG